MDRYCHMPIMEVPEEPFISEHPHLWVENPAARQMECMLCEATTAAPIEGRHSSCDHDWMETPNRIWVCTKCGMQQQR